MEDASAIAILLGELGYPSTHEFASAKLAEYDRQPRARVFVAEIDQIVVGFIAFDAQVLFHQPGLIGTIMALSVSERFRGQGIGRALVAEVERVAREIGCTKIAVASGVRREDAHRFYQTLGYEENTKRFVKQLQ